MNKNYIVAALMGLAAIALAVLVASSAGAALFGVVGKAAWDLPDAVAICAVREAVRSGRKARALGRSE